ncbi:hypothetical protein E2C01_043068 [Portunus trituberculatus]|uniref:Uncharacterized protein n=1 Tax=Portunus trituberculatus TaxID=210409 RepID=A0A5B7FVC1_PORTR|nr:hypothetical protein [Portunus trituberculatus]
MATPRSALESLSEGDHKCPQVTDCCLGIDPKSFDTSLSFFFINFCNIRSLSLAVKSDSGRTSKVSQA